MLNAIQNLIISLHPISILFIHLLLLPILLKSNREKSTDNTKHDNSNHKSNENKDNTTPNNNQDNNNNNSNSNSNNNAKLSLKTGERALVELIFPGRPIVLDASRTILSRIIMFGGKPVLIVGRVKEIISFAEPQQPFYPVDKL